MGLLCIIGLSETFYQKISKEYACVFGMYLSSVRNGTTVAVILDKFALVLLLVKVSDTAVVSFFLLLQLVSITEKGGLYAQV